MAVNPKDGSDVDGDFDLNDASCCYEILKKIVLCTTKL